MIHIPSDDFCVELMMTLLPAFSVLVSPFCETLVLDALILGMPDHTGIGLCQHRCLCLHTTEEAPRVKAWRSLGAQMWEHIKSGKDFWAPFCKDPSAGPLRIVQDGPKKP